MLALDHAIGARGARREPRIRQLGRAALGVFERGRRLLPAASGPLLRGAPDIVDLARDRPERERGLHALAAQPGEDAQRARHVGAERGFAELEHVEARAVADRRLHRGEIDALVRLGATSSSFSSSCCAASRLPSVRSTMKRTASSSISSSSVAARARSHCGKRASSTGQAASQAPADSNAFTQAELFCSRSSLPVSMR